MALVGDKSLRSHLLSFSDKSCNDWLFFVGVKEEAKAAADHSDDHFTSSPPQPGVDKSDVPESPA